MSKRVNEEKIRALVIAEAAKTSNSAVGERLGFSRMYISQIVSGKCGISESIGMAYGYDRHEKPAEVWFTKQETY